MVMNACMNTFTYVDICLNRMSHPKLDLYIIDIYELNLPITLYTSIKSNKLNLLKNLMLKIVQKKLLENCKL